MNCVIFVRGHSATVKTRLLPLETVILYISNTLLKLQMVLCLAGISLCLIFASLSVGKGAVSVAYIANN